MSESQSQEQGNQPAPEIQAQRPHRVEALADVYLERLLAGDTPDRQQFLAAHPELADLLGPRLELVELMHRIARAQRPAAGETASLAPPPAPDERVLRVKCPHCGNGIQLVEPASAEVTCSGCGSSFHIEPGATTSFHSATLPLSIGRFEVLEQLGRGAFGTVYKARDTELQRVVAVKVPRAGSFANPQEEERFLREARAAAQLSDPGIVPVLEIAHDRGLPYIVSEYIGGLTLADLLTARRPGFRQAAELTAAVADALDCAHRRHIVHRDIKPSNLLIDAAGRPHVTDFGLARRGEAEITVTLDGQILGTPAYMSPEQAAGDQQRVDARSDVYSLGVVLYEMLSGELPFRGNQRMLLHQVLHDEPRPPRSLNDRVPRDLETICLKAMAKAPARRYASAREMADDLRRFLNGEAIRARRVGRAEKLARWARRNPLVATLTAAVALLLLAVAVSEFIFVVTERRLNSDLSDALQQLEETQRETEVRAASAVVDLDLKHCQDGEIEYGVLRLARTLSEMPPHAAELRQCVEMNLLAWAQEIRPLGPTFQYDGPETLWKISPDGLTVLTAGGDGTARLWDAFTGDLRATWRGHQGRIESAAFSENGRVAMTVGLDRAIRFWDVTNGRERGVTAKQPRNIDKALLSPDGKRLLTIFHEGAENDPNAKAKMTLWGTATGKRITELAGHAGRVYDARFSPDGQTLLTGGNDKTARLWSAEDGRPLKMLPGIVEEVQGVAFSPQGNVAATLEVGESGFQVKWWDSANRLQLGSPCVSKNPFSLGGLVGLGGLGGIGGFRAMGDIARLGGPETIPFDMVYHDVAILSTHGTIFIRGREYAIAPNSAAVTEFTRADEERLFDGVGNSYNRTSLKRVAVPLGRYFHRDLSRFARRGRFLYLLSYEWNNFGQAVAPRPVLIDLATEKRIGTLAATTHIYASERETFISRNGDPDVVSGLQDVSSTIYIAIPRSPLNTEAAQLFAEVVTCHELDPDGTTRPLEESKWEERRKRLARKLEDQATVFPMPRLAADRWYWLRRQIGREKNGGYDYEKNIKYLDRLIAVEPTWQNYQQRADVHASNSEWIKSARDVLEAGRLAGTGYWHNRDHEVENNAIWNEMIWYATGSPDLYQMGLRLVEAIRSVRPNDREFRVLHAMALYRIGRYVEALSLLEDWQREWQRKIAAQAGQFLMRSFPAPLIIRQQFDRDTVRSMSLLAMTLYRLGQSDRARAVLADIRTLSDSSAIQVGDASSFDIFGEAKALIEGKPRPGK